MKKYAFGVDVGGTTVKLGLFSVDGEILDKWEIPTKVENNGAAILPDCAKAVLDKIAEKGIDKEEVAGIGIGIPGPVDDNGESPVAVNLHWGHVRIVHDMEEMTGLKTRAGNDANVAALGEMWKGGGEGSKNVVLITLGTGVGGGIIVNGQILAGAHGAGGEVGHIHVEDAITDKCNCGNAGCLEQVASATGIARLGREALEQSDEESLLRGEPVTAKTVFDAVKQGDALAIRVAEKFGKYLGETLAGIANVSDPDVIVIGGGVSKAGPILLTFVEKYFYPQAFPTVRACRFALATLGNDAGICGAAKMVL